MTKQVKEIAITAVLIIALAFILMANLRKRPAKKPALTAPAPAVGTGVSPAPVILAPVSPADEKRLDAQGERAKLPWGRNPFSVSTDKEYQRSDLKLKGISFGADKKGFAFINDEIVRVGDKVGDYEVFEIEKDKVLVGKGNQTFYLTLPQE